MKACAAMRRIERRTGRPVSVRRGPFPAGALFPATAHPGSGDRFPEPGCLFSPLSLALPVTGPRRSFPRLFLPPETPEGELARWNCQERKP